MTTIALNEFNPNTLVRDPLKRLLTVSRAQDGRIFVKEEAEPFAPEELEPVDPTNIVKFNPRLLWR